VNTLGTLQKTLRHHFDDLSLLQSAITHPSYTNEHPETEVSDNQRLEFLGDAALDFIIGAWVFRRYPSFDEGQMTRLRAALVRTETLAQFARQTGIGEALLLGRGEEEAGGRERIANLPSRPSWGLCTSTAGSKLSKPSSNRSSSPQRKRYWRPEPIMTPSPASRNGARPSWASHPAIASSQNTVPTTPRSLWLRYCCAARWPGAERDTASSPPSKPRRKTRGKNT
jgi:hypothetical protein